jgi:hypothetical protein
MPDNVDSVVLELPGDEDFGIGEVLGAKLDPGLDPELRRRWGLDKPDDEPVSSFNNFI